MVLWPERHQENCMTSAMDNARKALENAGLAALLAMGMNLPRTPAALAELPLTEPDAASLVPEECPARPLPSRPHQLQPSAKATETLAALLIEEDRKTHETRTEISSKTHPAFIKTVEEAYQDTVRKASEAGVAYIPPPPQKIYIISLPDAEAYYTNPPINLYTHFISCICIRSQTYRSI